MIEYILECTRLLRCPQYGKPICCFTCVNRWGCKTVCKQTKDITCKHIKGYDGYLDPTKGKEGSWIIFLENHARDGLSFRKGEIYPIYNMDDSDIPHSDVRLFINKRKTRLYGSVDYWRVENYVLSLVDVEKLPKNCKYCINNCKLNKENCPFYITTPLKMSSLDQ